MAAECVSPGDISPNPNVIKADYSGELICKLMHTSVLYNPENIGTYWDVVTSGVTTTGVIVTSRAE